MSRPTLRRFLAKLLDLEKAAAGGKGTETVPGPYLMFFTYLAGSASNFALQFEQQKPTSLPS